MSSLDLADCLGNLPCYRVKYTGDIDLLTLLSIWKPYTDLFLTACILCKGYIRAEKSWLELGGTLRDT